MRPRGKSTEFSPGEVVDLLATTYTQKGCFALLATMFPNVDTCNEFPPDIDHVFPQKWFTWKRLLDAKVSAEKVEQYQGRQHRLANLELLEGPTNIETSFPAEELGQVQVRRGL